MRTGTRLVVSVVVVASALATIVGTVAIVEAVDRDDAFVIDRFDREVVVRSDGSMDVTETIDVTFSEVRRGIFRDLEGAGPVPHRRVRYDIHDVDRGPGTPSWNWVRESTDEGDPRIRVGEASVFLDPGPQTYRFTYSIEGLAFRHADEPGTAEVRLDVPGDRWPTQVEATTLTVRLPAEPSDVACVVGRRGATDACPPPAVSGSTVTQELLPLGRNTTGTVGIQLPADAFGTALPTAEVRALQAGPGVLPVLDVPPFSAALLLTALMLLPALALEGLRGWFVYRDRVTDPALHDRVAPTAELSPPDGRAPIELAGLLRRSIGKEAVLATVVDLELRGAVRSSTSGTQKKPVITVEPADGTLPLRPWEASFLDALLPRGRAIRFDGEYDSDTAARVSAASTTLRTRAREALLPGSPLTHEGAPWLRGGRGVLVGLLVFVAWGLLGYAGVVSLGVTVAEVVVIVLVLLVTRVALRLLWRFHRLPLTSEGRDAIRRTEAFRTFLGEVHADRLRFAADQGTQTDHPVLTLLPYAIGLGLADSWYRRFEPMMSELVRTGQASTSDPGAWYLHHGTFVATSSSYQASVTAPSTDGGGGGSFGGGGSGSGGGGGGGGSW